MIKWAQITVETSEESSGAIENYLFDQKAAGVEIKTDPDKQNQTTLIAYFPVSDLVGARVINLRNFIKKLPSFGLSAENPELHLRSVPNENWSENWRSAFPPQTIGERIIIAPTWHRVETSNDEVLIRLNPGMAFGTGHHPTTQLSILLLEEVVKSGETVADIGTGSGILAIVAAKLGAQKIYAVDLDKKAVEIAEENCGHNSVEDIIDVKQMDRFSELNQKFNLIVANILTKVILPMIPQAPKYLKSGGHLILSGIMENEIYKVKTELISNKFECLKTRQHNEWFAILARLQK
ncbi:MAG: 50S ribosomal protein L11 methyltransferase [Candidatus Poribacteria bacterium]